MFNSWGAGGAGPCTVLEWERAERGRERGQREGEREEAAKRNQDGPALNDLTQSPER